MKLMPHTQNEITRGGYSHRLDFSFRDFPAGIANNTAKSFDICAVSAGDQIVQAHLHLTTPFENTADAAFNSVTFDFGDDSSATRYFSGVQIDINGTEVIDSYLDPTGDFIYTAAGILRINFNSMTAKSLSNLNKGKLYLEFLLMRHSDKAKNVDLSQPPYV